MLTTDDPLLIVLVFAFVFAVGSAWGSFLNVLIYRLPRDISVVLDPPSSCPSCAAPIRWFDNLPLVSWVALRGRCRRCNAPISMRYPLVETMAGVLTLLAFLRWGVSVTGVEVAVFATISLALALIDFDFQILPNTLTYPLIAFGLVCSAAGGFTPSWPDSLLGAVVGALLPTLVIVIYKLWRGIEGMGWGDVKYLAAIGAVAGLRGAVGVLIVAATLGALFGIGLIVAKKGSGKTALPFGTFLAAAVILWLYAPPSWLAWMPL
jgi:leader peptidase (prepilin peptidase)/N-methyltransferase